MSVSSMYSWLEATTGLRLPTAQTRTPASVPVSAGGVYRVNTAPVSPPINRGGPLPSGRLAPSFRADPFVSYQPGYEPSYPRITPQSIANPRVTPNRPSVSPARPPAQTYRNAAAQGSPTRVPRTPDPFVQYQPGYGSGSGIAARNAAAAAGATGSQANAAARAAASPLVSPAMASRGALGGVPLIGAGMSGAVTAGYVKATGGSWWESGGAGVGAAAGTVLGQSAGAAAGAAATVNPAGAVAGGVAGGAAGSIAGASIGAALGRNAGSILGRIPGVGGAIAAAVNPLIPGAGFIPLIGGPLRDWLQPDDVAGPPIPSTTVNVPGPPPFTGGQSVGVPYRVTTQGYSGGATFGQPQVRTVNGPISIRTTRTGTNQETSLFSGNSFVTQLISGSVSNNTRAVIVSTVRVDGLPDTGGDPLGDPIPVPTPSPGPRPSYPPNYAPTPATPDLVPSPYAPTPSQEPTPTPPLRPNAPPETAPEAPPPAPETLPPGDPLRPPAPAGDPTGVPQATPETVPGKVSTQAPTDNNPWPDWLIPALAGAAAGGLAVGTIQKVGDATRPGDFVQIPPATPTPPLPSPPDTGCKCNAPILAGQAGQTADINDLRARLIRIEGTQNGPTGFAGTFAFLTEMRMKLGAVGDFAETAWRATKMQKVLDVLTFIGVMHNVSMLSREVGETLFHLIGQSLDVVGIDDEEGNALNVGSIVGGSVNDFLRGVFGDVFVDGAIDSYRKANRIVQSASMVIWTVRSIQDSSLDLMEWVGENTGKIGNALKRFGVVGDRSYPWMAESAQARARGRARFDKLTNTLENAEDRLSSYTVATSNILEVQQETQELGENWQSFKTSLSDIPDPWGDNTPVQTQVAAEVAASPSPDIAAADTQRTN